MKILLTGFDPFGGESINPAWEAVKLVQAPAGVELVKREIPTVFGESAACLLRAVEEERPNAVLCVGQAGGRAKITPERVAINLKDARIPDNAGQQPVDEPVCAEGPAAYFATVPIKAMAEAMEQVGVAAEISNTAGTFVCNQLMYALLHAAAEKKLSLSGGFIHVPFLPQQAEGTDKPSMPLDLMVKGLEAALTAMRDN